MERSFQKRLAVGTSWITVDVYGDPGAPGLVLVPGVMSDAQAWAPVARSLGAWPSVVVVNRRGRQPSGPLGAGYTLRTEVEDLGVVLDTFDAGAVLGWSYGGLIALLAAEERPIRQVIAYEPVIRPFGAHALPELESAGPDRAVEIVNRRISGFDAAHVDALRADRAGWAALCRLSEPLYTELRALNAAPAPTVLARRADRVDLVVGGRNRSTAPYGTSFEDVQRRVPHAEVHELPGQGHLVHLEGPRELGGLLDALAVPFAGCS